MTAPKLFAPSFIGSLLEMQKPHKGNPPIFERLCVAVRQCREWNTADQERRDMLWPLMQRTRAELRELGVMVG